MCRSFAWMLSKPAMPSVFQYISMEVILNYSTIIYACAYTDAWWLRYQLSSFVLKIKPYISLKAIVSGIFHVPLSLFCNRDYWATPGSRLYKRPLLSIRCCVSLKAYVSCQTVFDLSINVMAFTLEQFSNASTDIWAAK